MKTLPSDEHEITTQETPPGLWCVFQEAYCHPSREEGKRRAIEEARKNAKHMGIPFIYRHRESLYGPFKNADVTVIDGIDHYSGFIQVYKQLIEADK